MPNSAFPMSQDDEEMADTIVVRPMDSASQRAPANIEQRDGVASIIQTTAPPSASASTGTSASSSSSAVYSAISASRSKKRTSHIWHEENGEEYFDKAGKTRWRCKRCKSFIRCE
jgi:hypothetical protein